MVPQVRRGKVGGRHGTGTGIRTVAAALRPVAARAVLRVERCPLHDGRRREAGWRGVVAGRVCFHEQQRQMRRGKPGQQPGQRQHPRQGRTAAHRPPQQRQQRARRPGEHEGARPNLGGQVRIRHGGRAGAQRERPVRLLVDRRGQAGQDAGGQHGQRAEAGLHGDGAQQAAPGGLGRVPHQRRRQPVAVGHRKGEQDAVQAELRARHPAVRRADQARHAADQPSLGPPPAWVRWPRGRAAPPPHRNRHFRPPPWRPIRCHPRPR